MESQSVCDAISAEVVRRAAEWYGPGSVVTGPVKAIETRRFSFFLRFHVRDEAGASNRVLVKIPRRPEIQSLAHAATEPDSPGAIREYESLVAIDRLVRETSDAGLGSIRPLGFLRPWNAFAMEHVEGRTLKRIVASPRWTVASSRDWLRLSRVFFAAGRWLSHFHERLDGIREAPVDVARLEKNTEQTLDALNEVCRGDLDLGSLRDRLRNAARTLSGRTDRVATLHGDFMAANILITLREQVVVLDTHRAETGSVHEDLSRLAMDLPTLKQQVLSHGLFYKEEGLQACRDALHRGYFGESATEPSLVALHDVLAIVRKWCFHEVRLAQSRRLPSAVRRRLESWLRPYFRRMIVERLAS